MRQSQPTWLHASVIRADIDCHWESQSEWSRGNITMSNRVANHKKFRGPPKVGRSPKLGDVSKGAACSKMATAKLGWVGEIVLMRSHNLCGPQNSF